MGLAKHTIVGTCRCVALALCIFFIDFIVLAKGAYAESSATTSPSLQHHTLQTVYNFVSATPFPYADNEIDAYGERALHLKDDERLYDLWRVLFAYKDDQNDAKFQQWLRRIQEQARIENDAHLDMLARFMRQAYQNELNGFTGLSEREWSAYMALSDPALQNIVTMERMRQLQHFSQWADSIDIGDKLIVHLSADNGQGKALLIVANQYLIYSLMSVGDYDNATQHMISISKLLKDNSFFSQKMDMLYNMSLWAAKENDFAVASKFQNLYQFYVNKYNVKDLKTWSEYLCANIADKEQNYIKVIECLNSSSIHENKIENFMDFTKIQYLAKAYARVGDIKNAKIFLDRIKNAPSQINPHDTLYEKGVEVYLLKAQGHYAKAFDELDDWSRARMNQDEAMRIQCNPSVGAALPVSFWSVQLSFWR
jgi:hypothetical protein